MLPPSLSPSQVSACTAKRCHVWKMWGVLNKPGSRPFGFATQQRILAAMGGDERDDGRIDARIMLRPAGAARAGRACEGWAHITAAASRAEALSAMPGRQPPGVGTQPRILVGVDQATQGTQLLPYRPGIPVPSTRVSLGGYAADG